MQLSADCFVAPIGPAQNVTYTGTAGTISNALPPGAQFAWIMVTTAAYITWGANPTATTSHWLIPANWPVKIPIPEALQGTMKVSAVQLATGGSLSVMPLQY